MSRLRPVNRATCPQCKGKTTKRVGFADQHRGSLWVCEACRTTFVVPLLQLAKKSG